MARRILISTLLAAGLLAGCASRMNDDEPLEKFSVTLDAAQDDINAALSSVSDFEVAELTYRDYALRASMGGRPGAVPRRPQTAADLARTALNPAFTAMAAYAARLTDPTGDVASIDAPSPDQQASAAGEAARALGQRAGKPLPESIVTGGQAAIQALATAATTASPRDVPAMVQTMQPQVVLLDAYVTAVIGADAGSGLRLVLSRAGQQAQANLDQEFTAIVADRAETRSNKVGRMQAALAARDAAPDDDLLIGVVRASHALVAAHAALANPEGARSEAALGRFEAAVEELGRRIGRFRRE